MLSEMPNFAKFVAVALPIFFSMVLFCVWLDYRDHRKQKAQWEKDRLEGLENDNRELRETLKEKNDEIFEHLEENTNLATERDALQMRVDDLERQLNSSQAEVSLLKKSIESRNRRVAQKLSDVLFLVKSEY